MKKMILPFTAMFLFLFAINSNSQNILASNTKSHLQHLDLLSVEILTLYYTISNNPQLSLLEENAPASPLLKNFNFQKRNNQIRFEDLEKDHPYYIKPSNINYLSSQKIDSAINIIEMDNSFLKSNLNSQKSNNYSFIGGWHFKVGPRQ